MKNDSTVANELEVHEKNKILAGAHTLFAVNSLLVTALFNFFLSKTLFNFFFETMSNRNIKSCVTICF